MRAKRRKRELAALLALCMLLFAAPFTVGATNTPEAEYSTDGGASWNDALLVDAIFATYTTDNGIIRLKRDVTLDENWYGPVLGYKNKSITLDGAGYTIQRGTYPYVFFNCNEAGAHVTLKNITLDGGAVWSDPGDVINRTNSGTAWAGTAYLLSIENGATVTLGEGAVLQNNALTEYDGAAVVVSNGGTLEMLDGAVIRNNKTASSQYPQHIGGGVYLTGGAFHMKGGNISGNYAKTVGGGVYVAQDADFQMTGGTISGNAAGNNSGAIGTNGNVTLTGGKIQGNAAPFGGGILMTKSVHIGGNIQITGNTNLTGAFDNVRMYGAGSVLILSEALSADAVIGVSSHTAPTLSAPIALTGSTNNYIPTPADKAKFINDNRDYRIAMEDSILKLKLLDAPDLVNATITANATIPSPTYTVTIPSIVDAGNLVQKASGDADKIKSTPFTVGASSIDNLFGEKQIFVKLSTESGTFELADGENKLAYSVYDQTADGYALDSGDIYATFTAAGEQAGRIEIDQSAITRAGSYTGTMTFTISVEGIK